MAVNHEGGADGDGAGSGASKWDILREDSDSPAQATTWESLADDAPKFGSGAEEAQAESGADDSQSTPENAEVQKEAIDITKEVGVITGNLREIKSVLDFISEEKGAVVSYKIPLIGGALRSDMTLEEMQKAFTDAGQSEEDVLWVEPAEEAGDLPEAVDVSEEISKEELKTLGTAIGALRERAQSHGTAVSMRYDGVTLRSDMTDDQIFKTMYGMDKGTARKQRSRIYQIYELNN